MAVVGAYVVSILLVLLAIEHTPWGHHVSGRAPLRPGRSGATTVERRRLRAVGLVLLSAGWMFALVWRILT